MNLFAYERALRQDSAVEAIARENSAKFLAGGTNLVDLMKNGVERPERIIDINRLPLTAIEALPDGGLRLGALARNAETANHPLVRKQYPMLSRAILSGASPQLRNLATNGGNLMQRTRCPYFMDSASPQCNKREPGSGCGALEGFNRSHAIFGASDQCIATHPSDMCVALAALDAVIRVRSQKGERRIPIAEFHRLPGDTPQIDTNLRSDELIVSIDLPPSASAGHSHYLKVRDRASYEFALVSVAALLDVENGTIQRARIVLGGVAHKPWHCASAEKLLAGKNMDAALFQQAGSASVAGARPYPHNAFKVELTKRAVTRALNIAGGIA
jgi:xanthine dehydrogenase YagS FAD-binding subunit